MGLVICRCTLFESYIKWTWTQTGFKMYIIFLTHYFCCCFTFDGQAFRTLCILDLMGHQVTKHLPCCTVVVLDQFQLGGQVGAGFIVRGHIQPRKKDKSLIQTKNCIQFQLFWLGSKLLWHFISAFPFRTKSLQKICHCVMEHWPLLAPPRTAPAAVLTRFLKSYTI